MDRIILELDGTELLVFPQLKCFCCGWCWRRRRRRWRWYCIRRIRMITSPSRFRVSSLICETIVSHYTLDIQILRFSVLGMILGSKYRTSEGASGGVGMPRDHRARSLPLRLSHDFLLLYDAQIDFKGRLKEIQKKKAICILSTLPYGRSDLGSWRDDGPFSDRRWGASFWILG